MYSGEEEEQLWLISAPPSPPLPPGLKAVHGSDAEGDRDVAFPTSAPLFPVERRPELALGGCSATPQPSGGAARPPEGARQGVHH